ncbi:MAG: hypothetical protein ACI398_05685 [Clostridium sp.]
MNLYDIQKEGEELKKILPETEKAMKSLIDIVKSRQKMQVELFKKSFESHTMTQERLKAYVTSIDKFKENYCSCFFNNLRKIKFTKSIIELTKVTREFKYYDFNKFRKKYIDLMDKIDEYTESQSNINQFEKIEKVYNNIREITKLYKNLFIDISKINDLTNILSPGMEACHLNIRFMNENKTISALKENIILIENIYNTINRLVGNEEEELIYYRVESGTFLLFLGGCATTLLTMLPLLQFSYKVYSEQFSSKAKLELEYQKQEVLYSKIKVRGEYLKLLKQAENSRNELKLDTIEKSEIITLLGDLDSDIKELYSKNPYIQLNNIDLGVSDMCGEKIPIDLLKCACDETALTVSDLENNVIQSRK